MVFRAIIGTLLLVALAWGRDAAETMPALPSEKPDWSTPIKTFWSYKYAAITGNGKVKTEAVAWEREYDAKVSRYERPDPYQPAEMREWWDLFLAVYPEDELVKKRSEENKQQIAEQSEQLKKRWRFIVEFNGEPKENIDGDKATITAGGNVVMKLKHDGDRWWILPESVGAPFPAAPQEIFEDSEREVKIRERINELLSAGLGKFKEDVKSKKFGTGKEAIDAWTKVYTDAHAQAVKEFPPRK